MRVASVGVARNRLGGEDSVWGTAAAAVVAPIHAGYSPSSTPCSAKTDLAAGVSPSRHSHEPPAPLETSPGVLSRWRLWRDTGSVKSLNRGHRFPPEIISHAVWLCHRFTLSFRDVEDLLALRGVTVSYEAIRLWCRKFGPTSARNLRRRHGRLGDVWHVDEVFVTIRGSRRYLWRAVDQDGDILDILVTRRRDAGAAKRFFRKLMKGQGGSPWQMVTDRLRSYVAACRELGLWATHRTGQSENNRAEVSHPHTREQEHQTRRIKRRPSVFSRSMRPPTTHSGSHATVSRRSIIDSFGSGPSPLGRPRRVFTERSTTHRCADQNRFGENNLTISAWLITGKKLRKRKSDRAC